MSKLSTKEEHDLVIKRQRLYLKSKDCNDPVVLDVCMRLIERSIIGEKKYDTTLDKNNLPLSDWLNHAFEEVLDFANYIEKTRKQLQESF